MSAVIFDSCISYYSYIKPQPSHHFQVDGSGCISYYSYIKPQPELATRCFNEVVYRTIPTSNHNVLAIIFVSRSVVYRTIPTSNHNPAGTSTCFQGLYIVLFLHQTTTGDQSEDQFICCISYYSYIKPQLLVIGNYKKAVVYRTIPTSNHNHHTHCMPLFELYIVLFLHQTTTIKSHY